MPDLIKGFYMDYRLLEELFVERLSGYRNILLFTNPIVGFLVCRKTNKMQKNTTDIKRLLFLWSSEEVSNNLDQFLNDLIMCDFDRVFQTFSSTLSEVEAIPFLLEIINARVNMGFMTKINTMKVG